jgi:two-component system response regulator CpxR
MSEEKKGARVLVVDDDEELCELVGKYLKARGFHVEFEGDGARGLDRARRGECDILVLDVMLPSMDGLEVLRRLRSGGETARLPVVMLTAHGDETDRIVGLELGADDYLPKPFNPRELLARIQAVLRRVAMEARPSQVLEGSASPQVLRTPPPMMMRAGRIEMNVGARTVRCESREVELTAVEFDVLLVLLKSAGHVVSRDDLARQGMSRRLLPMDRSLDMHISNLRAKLWPGGGGLEKLKTVRGVGYIYAESEASHKAAASSGEDS